MLLHLIGEIQLFELKRLAKHINDKVSNDRIGEDAENKVDFL